MDENGTDQYNDSHEGWKSIDTALAGLYPGQDPAHFGTLMRYSEGGPDPLDGMSAYVATSPDGTCHWHFVSYGLTELYEKTSEDASESGWGFELTFRLGKEVNETKPAMWPLNLLQTLARYVFNTGEVFGHGHYIEMGGSLVNSRPTDLTALVFNRDPQLPAVESPNGRFEFIQAVGITDQEYKWIQANDPELFLAKYHQADPLMITVLKRPSLV